MLSVIRTLVLLGICFHFIALVSSSEPHDLTALEEKVNAQRLALGLPPVRPKNQRPKAGKLPAKFEGAIPGESQIKPFSVPIQSSKGYIAVHRENIFGEFLGYLKESRVVSYKDQATLYEWTKTGSKMEISIASSRKHLCIAAGYYGPVLAPGSKNFHLSRTTLLSTTPGGKHADDSSSATRVETAVFVLRNDNEITAHWVNPDAKLPTTQIALSNSIVYYVGDIAAFRAYVNAPVDLVVFKWEATQ